MPRYIFPRRGSGSEWLLAHLLRFTAVLGACVALSSRAAAQDQPTVFIHGLFGTGGVWQQTANTLADELEISPILPTLGWFNPFGTQATNLQNALTGVSGIPALAHSNGGLVARQYLKQFGSGSRINRIMTIGTPHQGALLAREVTNGDVFAYADRLSSAIADPINYYYFNDPDFQQAVDFGTLDLLLIGADYMEFIARNFDILVNVVGVPIPGLTDAPVLQQMPPGSAFLTALNTSTNLSAERAHTLVRVGAASGVAPQNAFFSLFSDNPAAWGAVRRTLQYSALVLYNYYSTHPDLFLRANAGSWLALYFYLQVFDVQWHFFIGSLAGFQGPFAIVGQQDGLVPLSSATWPGANKQRNLLWPTYTIPHRSQISDPDMRHQMLLTLRDDFGVAARASSSPPIPPPPPIGGCADPRQLICDP